MSDTDQTVSVEDEIEALEQAAALSDSGQLPTQEATEEVPDESATTDDPDGSEGDSEENESQVTDSTGETDSGTEDTNNLEDELGADKASESDAEQPPSRKEKKEQALTRSWENANKRHADADARETQLKSLELQLRQQEQELAKRDTPAPNDPLAKFSTTDIEASIQAMIDEGDLDNAKALVGQLSQKAEAIRLAKTQGPDNPQFKQAWDHVRGKVIQENPELTKADTPLYKAATGLLEGDWGQVLNSHPLGVAAAVEVAKLQIAANSVPELEKQVEQLTQENAQLKRSVQLNPSSGSRGGKAPSKKALSVEEEIAELESIAVREG